MLVFDDGMRSSSQSARNDALLLLTPRERDVAIAVARGLTTENIATRLGIKVSTVRTLLRGVFRKTKTHTRLDLARMVMGIEEG